MMVPLIAGHNGLGAFGISSVTPFVPTSAEVTFLERVASGFAVAVEAFLARQAAIRERDRPRTLFDITNALVSKLNGMTCLPRHSISSPSLSGTTTLC